MSDSDKVVLFHERKVIVADGKYLWEVKSIARYIPHDSVFFLVETFDQPVFTLEVSINITDALSAESYSLRRLIFSDMDDQFILAGKANQIIEWSSSHKYCGSCGKRTVPAKGQRVLNCSECQIQYFPRINPCVIVLITRGSEILLARNARFRTGFFSCLAGFIEIGESAENTVHREIKEEVGVLVENVRYKKSQSWPFPSQLMLGFHADYSSGEIVAEPSEIEEASWFDISDLPSVPSAKISVAGELIQLYKEEIKLIKA